MAYFKQRFRVNAPLSAVWLFHEDPKALRDLTPPPFDVQIVQIDRPLKAGARLQFRLGIGPVGVLWDVIYDEFDPYQPGKAQCSFVDRTVRGPFHTWLHRHTFKDLGDETSAVADEAWFELIGGPLGKPINWLLVWPAIAVLFLYRRIKTRRMLGR